MQPQLIQGVNDSTMNLSVVVISSLAGVLLSLRARTAIKRPSKRARQLDDKKLLDITMWNDDISTYFSLSLLAIVSYLFVFGLVGYLLGGAQ